MLYWCWLILILLLVAEAELLARAQRGDMTSLGQLFESQRDALRFWLQQHFSLSYEDIEDAIQLTFLQVTREIGTLTLKCQFKTYLFAVARHRCLDQVRQRQRRPVEELDDTFRAPDTPESAVVSRQALAHAVSTLSAYEQLLLQYACVDHLTRTAIAPLVGKSIAQVSRDLTRVLEKIRHHLHG